MNSLYRIAVILCMSVGVAAQKRPVVTAWITDPAQSVYFMQQEERVPFLTKEVSVNEVILVDDEKTYQTIDGFGFALTGGSAMNMMKMSRSRRADLLRELFATDKNNIGTSYLRVSIGASDLNEFVFSYDDIPAGQTDTNLVHFDLGPDKKDVIPVLKEILAINPRILILASPWSPPVWMKTNGDTKGGSLQPRYYDVYAKYFIKYIQAMKKAGIRIDAITVQNEPLHPGNNPSLLMPAADQANFVKNHLGPAFHKTHIDTKIIIYDHNADKPEYPISILNDAGAKKYIDGSAFHLYGGSIETLSKVHNAHPNRNLYFTEQWVGAPGNFQHDIAEHIEKLIIGATRNWSRNVIEWNLAADKDQNPHTDRGGCNKCLGAITIDGNRVSRNPAYYIIAHAAKWVRPGSVRIASDMVEGLPNVAFRNPAGQTILIVLNTSVSLKTFAILQNGSTAVTSLPPGATGTFIW